MQTQEKPHRIKNGYTSTQKVEIRLRKFQRRTYKFDLRKVSEAKIGLTKGQKTIVGNKIGGKSSD